MWYGEMCVHLYDLLDVLAAKATATTEATATTAAAKKQKRAPACCQHLEKRSKI